MNKVKASLGILGITLAAVLCLAAFPGRERPAAQVTTCRVTLGTVEQVLALNGTLGYEMEYAAVTPQAGVVEAVYVRPGDRVQAGQALFRLNGKAQGQAVAALLSGGSSLGDMGAELTQTRLQQAMAQLEALTVRAAADGLVQQVQVTPYGGVAAGAAAVLLSGESQAIRCSAVLRDAERLRPGMQASILKDGACLTTAVVAEIGPAQVNAGTGQVQCQVTLTPAAPVGLPLGAALEVEITLASRNQVPVVPIQALTERDTLWWVADGRCYQVPAQVLLADEANCWVPLPVGTEIICGGEIVEEGQRVKAVTL